MRITKAANESILNISSNIPQILASVLLIKYSYNFIKEKDLCNVFYNLKCSTFWSQAGLPDVIFPNLKS
jgi:hypothetical protein